MASRFKGKLSGLPNKKSFNGVTYYLFVGADSKKEAEKQAARLRRKGYNARIHDFEIYHPSRIPQYRVAWGVFSNPKTPHWYSGAFLKKRK